MLCYFDYDITHRFHLSLHASIQLLIVKLQMMAMMKLLMLLCLLCPDTAVLYTELLRFLMLLSSGFSDLGYQS